MKKRGQISFEYLMVMGFVTFVLMVLLGIALSYSTNISDRLKVIQIENFAKKIVTSSETVFYAGKPSKTTILVDLPDGVQSITTPINVTTGYAKGILISYNTVGGLTTSFYDSNVPINITAKGCDGMSPGTLCPNRGTRNIVTEAQENGVKIDYPA
jgi:hypothetical protein